MDNALTENSKLSQNCSRKKGIRLQWLENGILRAIPLVLTSGKVLQGQGPYYNPPMNTPDGVKKITGYTTDVITDVSLDWLKIKEIQTNHLFS
jgi:hypothetical protein